MSVHKGKHKVGKLPPRIKALIEYIQYRELGSSGYMNTYTGISKELYNYTRFYVNTVKD